MVFGKQWGDESRCNARAQTVPGRLSKSQGAIDLGSIALIGAAWLPEDCAYGAWNKRRFSRLRPTLVKNARRWLASSGCSPRILLDLLVDLGKRDAKLTLVVGQALARERDQALANQKRAEQERSIQAAKARRLGAELGYPAVDALDLGEGEDHWRTYLANPKHSSGATVCRNCQAR